MASTNVTDVPFTLDQESTSFAPTPDPCLETRRWPTFLASSLVAFFGGLIIILFVRLVRYCVRYRENPVELNTHQQSPSVDVKVLDPPNLHVSCSTKLKWSCEKLMSGQNVGGRILVSVSCLLSIGSLVIYLTDATLATNAVETCVSWTENINQQIDFAFNIVFLFIFFVRFSAANDKLLFWLEIASIVDYFTIPPSFVGIWLNRQWLGLRFLRALRLMSFPDILQYLSILRTSNSIRLAQLMFIFIGVTLAGAGFIHLVETTGDPFADYSNGQELAYWEAVYFCLVTMSTVGYGDIYCVTTIGRIFMVIFILGALAMFASFIPEMMEIFGKRQRYIGSYEKPMGVKHVVLCGHITYESVQHFLRDFLHEDRGNNNVKCLFLDNKQPDLELEALFKRHFTRVTFYKGTAMSTRDLERVKLHDADACLVLANPRSRDPDAQDAANVMRVIAVKNYCEDIRVIVQLMRYHNKAFCMNLPSWQQTDQVICLSEMKLGFMAQGCIAPGFSTLMANLFVMRSYKKSKKCIEWQDKYLEGSGMEMYTGYFSSVFYGKTFPEAAQICYTKLNILLLAIAIPNGSTAQPLLLLNPGSDVIINRDVKGFFMCQSEDEAKRALYFCPRCHLRLSNRCLSKPCKCGDQGSLDPSHTTDVVLEEDADGGFLTIEKSKLKFKCRNGATAEPGSYLYNKENMKPIDAPDKDNLDNGVSSPSETIPVGRKSRFHTKDRFDSTGLFYWCPKRSIDDCILLPEKNQHLMDKLRGHVVVCLFCEKSDPLIGLCNFIMPLRASTLRKEELKPIVLLGDEEYLRNEWDMLSNFPHIYIKPGSPLNRTHLRMVRINRCHMCVILTTNTINQEDLTLIDKEAILCSLNIKTMSFEGSLDDSCFETSGNVKQPLRSSSTMSLRPSIGQQIPMLTELANDHNAQFLDQDDDDDPATPLYMTQPFACGRAFAASVLDTLMSTTYFNSELLSLIRMLITGGANSDLEQQLAEDLGFLEGHYSSEDIIRLRSRSRVNLLPLKSGILAPFNNGCYGSLFIGAFRLYGILCLGIYRLINQKQDNGLGYRYVITNPSPSAFVNDSDQVYCLQPYAITKEGTTDSAAEQEADTRL